LKSNYLPDRPHEDPADLIGRIRGQADYIEAWLRHEAPWVADEQRHLDDGTPERAYWHYSYLVALCDVLRALRLKANSLS